MLQFARRLRNAGNGMPERVVGVFWNYLYADEIMSSIYRHLQEEADSKRYRVEFIFRFFHPDKLFQERELLTSQQFSGVIVYGITDVDEDFLNNSVLNLPIVVQMDSITTMERIMTYHFGWLITTFYVHINIRNIRFSIKWKCLKMRKICLPNGNYSYILVRRQS